MKKTVVILLAVFMVTAAGCQKKEEPAKTAVPKANVQAVAPQAAAQAVAPPAVPKTAAVPPLAPVNAASGNPHVGMKAREIPPGAAHKGKVVQTMDAGGYTYAEVEEKEQNLWVAVMKTEVKKGDIIEFPDSPPVVNFESKTLKKTFDKIIFAEGLRVVK